MTGRVRWARYLSPKPPRFLVSAIRRTRRKATDESAAGEESLATPVVFGLLTGILPCGPAVAAELASATSGSAITGALGMLAFGVGTAPLLLAFGASASLIPHRFKERLNLVLALAVMVWGAIFLNQALMLAGSPVTFATAKQAVLGRLEVAPTQSDAWTVASDGVVEVPLAYVDMEFVPREVRIPADRPVRLIVDRRGDRAGPPNKQIAIPQLHILQDVEASRTTPVAIPSAKAGTYTLTSWKGLSSSSLRRRPSIRSEAKTGQRLNRGLALACPPLSAGCQRGPQSRRLKIPGSATPVRFLSPSSRLKPWSIRPGLLHVPRGRSPAKGC